MKPLISSLRQALARHGRAAMASACASLVAAGLAGVWSLALAQQPYPAPGSQEPYPAPGTRQQQPPPPNYEQAAPPWTRQQQQQQQQARQPSQRELRCAQLEHELANDWVRREQGISDGPKVEAEIRKYDRIFQSTQAKAERAGCYESVFIFGRSLVRTPRCIRLHNQIEDARRQLESLEAQRQARSGGQSRRKQELISALARAGCGDQYQRQAARRGGGRGFMSWLEEGFWDTAPRQGLETSRIEQYATYRTLCVRQCDGYYFPVSFSTLPRNFSQDVQQCQSQCAAPADLYVYRNPGEEAEQMVSSDGSQAYNDLPNAWRYRKEFVKGCSCKEEEYDPAEIAAANEKAEAESAQAQGGAPQGGGAQFGNTPNRQ